MNIFDPSSRLFSLFRCTRYTLVTIQSFPHFFPTSSPTLHMSASFPYRPTPSTVFLRLSTSGAKYCGVPQKVLRPSLFARLASPKSVILTSTSLSLPTRRMFSGFKSLPVAERESRARRMLEMAQSGQHSLRIRISHQTARTAVCVST